MRRGQVVGFFGDDIGAPRCPRLCGDTSEGDTIPPVITVAASPETLWPPNGKLVPVTMSGTITDESGVQGSSYQVMDEYGQVQPKDTVTPDEADGSYAFTIKLQASRNGNDRDGRRYTIVVSVTDNAGNVGSASTSVTVPHDQGR